jgi:hypothetical protein
MAVVGKLQAGGEEALGEGVQGSKVEEQEATQQQVWPGFFHFIHTLNLF